MLGLCVDGQGQSAAPEAPGYPAGMTGRAPRVRDQKLMVTASSTERGRPSTQLVVPPDTA